MITIAKPTSAALFERSRRHASDHSPDGASIASKTLLGLIFSTFLGFGGGLTFAPLLERGATVVGASPIAAQARASGIIAAANGGAESVVVVNATARARELRVEGLRNGSYFRAVWNRDGTGALERLSKLPAQQGAVTVEVPARGLVALSTRDFMP